ncbi:hypothetical protein ACJQWK_01471 [Exserohilum turcicum]
MRLLRFAAMFWGMLQMHPPRAQLLSAARVRLPAELALALACYASSTRTAATASSLLHFQLSAAVRALFLHHGGHGTISAVAVRGHVRPAKLDCNHPPLPSPSYGEPLGIYRRGHAMEITPHPPPPGIPPRLV